MKTDEEIMEANKDNVLESIEALEKKHSRHEIQSALFRRDGTDWAHVSFCNSCNEIIGISFIAKEIALAYLIEKEKMLLGNL